MKILLLFAILGVAGISYGQVTTKESGAILYGKLQEMFQRGEISQRYLAVAKELCDPELSPSDAEKKIVAFVRTEFADGSANPGNIIDDKGFFLQNIAAVAFVTKGTLAGVVEHSRLVGSVPESAVANIIGSQAYSIRPITESELKMLAIIGASSEFLRSAVEDPGATPETIGRNAKSWVAAEPGSPAANTGPRALSIVEMWRKEYPQVK